MAVDTTNENGSEPIQTEELSLEAQVEALLFVAPGAVTPKQLAQALEITPRKLEKTLGETSRKATQCAASACSITAVR